MAESSFFNNATASGLRANLLSDPCKLKGRGSLAKPSNEQPIWRVLPNPLPISGALSNPFSTYF